MNVKKITQGIVVCLLSLLTLSCSNDDNSVNEKFELVVKANSANFYIGDDVLLEVTDSNGKAIDDAQITVNNELIDNYKFIAKEKGEFFIKASKKGYIDSQVLKIKINQKTIVITADKERAKYGDEITFLAKDESGKDITSDVNFYIDANKIEGNVYKVGDVKAEQLIAYARMNEIVSNEVKILLEQPILEKVILGKWKLENSASHDVFYNFYEGNTFDFIYFGTLMEGEYRIIDNKIHLDVINYGFKMTDYSIITVKSLSNNEIDVHVTVTGVHENGQAGRLVRQKEDLNINLKQLEGEWNAELDGKVILNFVFNNDGSCKIVKTENANGLKNLESIDYLTKYNKYSKNTIMMENRNGAYTYYLTINEFIGESEIDAVLFEYVLFPQKSTNLILKKVL
ncbi:hypothetical protein [Myroides injenensis]|uniref:hypothetical protein n=1 Tax=Myroides injenensis TaxID=1183151 RepID=UPI0002885660|nr:hypothetical protein [Myroides injenensis]